MEEWQNPQIIALWIAIALLVVISLILYIIFFSRIYFKRIIREKEKLSEAKLQYQKQLLSDSILVQEQERNRIAANLHDDLISKINVAKLSLYAGKAIDDVYKMLESSCEIARGISHDLCPPLVEELEMEDLINEHILPLSGSIETEFHKTIVSDISIPTDQKIQILRIVQEVINNCLKYANAKKLIINLHISNQCFMLKIQDDGIGFDQNQKHKGLGLRNIELRLQVLNAKYKIKSEPGSGTNFIMYINRNP